MIKKNYNIIASKKSIQSNLKALDMPLLWWGFDEQVPDGDVEVKVFLSNNDVGFVKNQMEADIRIDA